MLTGDKATLAAVRREIGTWLPSVAKEDDRVLIYFAGHGFMSRVRATWRRSISNATASPIPAIPWTNWAA